MKTNSNYKLDIGADPEFLLTTKDGEAVSAIEVLKQGKENPIQLGNGRTVYYDNVLCEASIIPATTRVGFQKTCGATLSGIAQFLQGKHKIVTKSAHHFKEDQLQHEDARVLGCTPSYDAYLVRPNPSPVCPPNLRVAGGHVHLGRDDFKLHEDHDNIPLLDAYSKCDVVKMMDICVGLPLAIIDKDPTSAERKQLYGKAGEHRPCPYGVEYRTPSNYWLNHPELVGLIFDLTYYAVSKVISGEHQEVLDRTVDQEVIEAVNTNNPDNAAKILEKVNLPSELIKQVFSHAKVTYSDLYKAWGLN